MITLWVLIGKSQTPTRCWCTHRGKPFIKLLKQHYFVFSLSFNWPLPASLRSLPLSVSLSVNSLAWRHLPIKGSWDRIFGAQPWSRQFNARLNWLVWTAVRARLQLCGHTSTSINPFSRPTVRPSLAHTQYIYGESLFLGSMEGMQSMWEGRWVGLGDEDDGGGQRVGTPWMQACVCLYMDHSWQHSGSSETESLVTVYDTAWKRNRKKGNGGDDPHKQFMMTLPWWHVIFKT